MSSADDDLPVRNPRPYVRIEPAEDSLAPDAVETTFRRLHQLQPDTDQSLLESLLGGAERPTIEWLLVSDPTETGTTIEYAVSIDPPELTDALEGILRDLFPSSYAFERQEAHPAIEHLHGADESTSTAVEFRGRPERRRDWQTRLTPFAEFQQSNDADQPAPLSAVVESLATASVPCLVQILCRPLADWADAASVRRAELEDGTDTLTGSLATAVLGSPEEYEPSATDQERLAEIDAKNPRRSFAVNVRGLCLETGDDATGLAHTLSTAFGHVGRTTYDVEGTVQEDAEPVREAIRDRTVHLPNYDALRNRLPFTKTTSEAIVADAGELGSFCLVDGSALTTEGTKAIQATPGERTPVPLPPAEYLERYHGHGLPLGQPLSADRTAHENPLVLPPALQPLHVAWIGKTGSGKSTALLNAILQNHAATDGADILVDPKGDGMAQQYLRAHYATYGDLDDVLYFDCSEVVPAFSIFDVRDELEAGIPRSTAVEDVVDHYVEMLTQIMGRERFEQAVRSPDVIRYLVKAMFDPVSGDDAFAHADLHSTVRQMHERQSAPPVADEDLERMLAGVVANRSQSFDEIMQGVANRIEKIPVDRRLARLFNHVPEGDDPRFDLSEYLDENVVILLDTGDLRNDAQRVLTLVVLSKLWTALRKRNREETNDEGTQTATDDDDPLVNLYLEEAASVAVSDLLQDLLAQSRSFDCSVTLAMQFPEQLRAVDEGVYRELLNNVSTFVTGNVAIDDALAKRLATDDDSPQAVGNRLRALSRGEWLVKLPAGFDEAEPRPFLVESLPLPPGHTEGDRPATGESFEAAVDDLTSRTREEAGLTLAQPSTIDDDGDAAEEEAPQPTAGTISSALPYTQRLPPTVEYDGDIHALRCTGCDNRYDASTTGMRRAIDCCSSLDDVDRDDVPICSVQLKLAAEERDALEWSDRQLLFLQAVYNAQQLRYDPLEYDLLHDSMLRLQEYTGVDTDDVQDLIDAGLLRHDTDHPHRLYTVTPDGRSTIGEGYRRGVDYGHGCGDLEESSQHVLGVEVLRQYIERTYVDDADSAVVEVVPYYEPTEEDTAIAPAAMAMGGGDEDLEEAMQRAEQRRLDVVGLDADGEIVVAGEVERVNNDVRSAVPEDYDKIAACEPAEAIWVVMTQSDGHDILEVLNDPPEGEPRVEKTYSDTTPPQQFRIDTPGLTEMYTVNWVRNRLDESGG